MFKTPCFVALLFLYSLISRRLERTLLTGPMLFTLVGAALGFWQERGPVAETGTFLRLAEVGLVLLLFCDASRTDLKVLWDIRQLPARLLSVGMLLTLALGTLIARLLFPEFSWWEAGILSAILAPTDAGLGLVIVGSPRVPKAVRQSLNVEAGLNDGLSVPFLLFFLALAAAGGREANLLRLVWQQLGLGLAVGLGVGLLGGWLIQHAKRSDWMAHSSLGTAVVVLPVLCLLGCEPLGASAFIAAFVAGLASRVTFPEVGEHSVEFSEEWGQIFNNLVFFLFGLLAMGTASTATAPVIGYALLSLTVVRMVPVAVAMLGTGFTLATTLFMGWFGPRGLASIVLGMVYLEEQAQLPGEPLIKAAVVVTVGLSILAHGMTALPGIELYANKVAQLPEDSPERQD